MKIHDQNRALATTTDMPSDAQVNAGLLLLRLACGIPFLYHGAAILFGAFGGPGPQGFSDATHLPLAVAYLVGLAQFAGGLALLSGVLTRLGALCIAIVMLGAIFMVHLPHGFDVSKGGFEYALTQLLAAGALMCTGAGAYSLVALLPGHHLATRLAPSA